MTKAGEGAQLSVPELPANPRALSRLLSALGDANASSTMPIIGGTTSWLGPVIGAVLLGTVQQLVTVTVSSELNVLVVGVVLVAFVVAAPQGIIGLIRRMRARRVG